MAENRKQRPQRQPEALHDQRGGHSDHRAGQDGAGANGEAEGVPSEVAKADQELDEVRDMAVVDPEARAIDVVQPTRGCGSRMPYETYRKLVLLLREGVPVVRLSDRFEVSTTTIHEIKARHADVVPSHREAMVRKSEDLRELLGTKMTESVENGRMSPNQYAFTYGVVSDKYLTETGQNNQKHEHIHVNLDKNDLGSLLSGLNPEGKSGPADEKAQKTRDI